MTIEDRLREALEHRTSLVEPSSQSLHRIEDKLVDAQQRERRVRALVTLGSAAAIVAVVVGTVAFAGYDRREDPAFTTTTADSSTTETTTTTTTNPVPVVDPAIPVWPRALSEQRFDDPVSAARSFVEDFVGMVDPIVGPFEETDSASGEVLVQAQLGAQVSAVVVRRLEDGTWFVVGAHTDDIRLDSPTSGSDIDCPARLTGEALAFEGVVQVTIRDDYTDDAIGTGFVQGGGGPSAPFDGTVDCDLSLLGASRHHGSIMLSTEGGEDSRIWQFTVVRVALK